jgi:hypothetical protein
MEETCAFETAVDFQLTKWRYIPDDRTLHNPDTFIRFWDGKYGSTKRQKERTCSCIQLNTSNSAIYDELYSPLDNYQLYSNQ